MPPEVSHSFQSFPSKHLSDMHEVFPYVIVLYPLHSHPSKHCIPRLHRKLTSNEQMLYRFLATPTEHTHGAEDAHFICTEEQAIGVADGVGGWADVGVNAGLFARKLMSHSVRAIEEEPKGSINPSRVLEKAHSCTKARGSSTACIITLSDTGLHAINLGDSGFIVVRDGCTIFRSPVQQHDFNFDTVPGTS